MGSFGSGIMEPIGNASYDQLSVYGMTEVLITIMIIVPWGFIVIFITSIIVKALISDEEE